MTDKNNILLMIPDYLEGRLSAQDRLIVETSIDQDAEFAAEFEFQKNIKAALLINGSSHRPSSIYRHKAPIRE